MEEIEKVIGCIGLNDTVGLGKCYMCMEDVGDGIDYEKDVCAQLEKKADSDPQWCVAAEDCVAVCTNTMDGTRSACESDWNNALACLDMTAEDLETAMSGAGNHCPGVCPDVSVTALN